METYDTKMLYVFTNGLDEREIAHSIAMGIEKYEKESGDKIQSFFRVNVVKNQANEPIGYAWIYVTNSKLYQLLSGNNPNGTERIMITEQKNFTKPSKPYEQMLKEKLREVETTSWARELDEEEITRKVKKMYQPPKIETKLPPLIKPEPILKDGEEVVINLSRGKLSYPQKRFVPNQLKNSNYTVIESWLDRNMLYEIFRPYVSNWEDFRYPKIRVNEKTMNEQKSYITVFIEYNPETTDALAALNMVKKIYLKNPEGEEVMLSFNFSKERI